MPDTVQHRKLPPPRFPHVISYRVSDEHLALIEAGRSTFDPPTPTEMFRWLFDTDEFRELIRRRVNGDA